MLILELNAASPEFSPGQTIAGRAGWRESRPPRDAALRLFWYTEGRGTQDIGIVAEQPMDVSQNVHEETFAFTLPAAPYSFAGKLISLRWALELVVNHGRDAARSDLLVSPWVKQVELGSVGTEIESRWQVKLA